MRGVVSVEFRRFCLRSNHTASLCPPQSVEPKCEVVNEFDATQQGEANEKSGDASKRHCKREEQYMASS
jgi:hypothetical protein